MVGTTLALEEYERVFMLKVEEGGRLRGTVQQPMDLESKAGHALLAAVRCALNATGYLPLRNLTLAVNGGSVKLDGQVSSYHLKQLAQTAVKRVPGVVTIINVVEVVASR